MASGRPATARWTYGLTRRAGAIGRIEVLTVRQLAKIIAEGSRSVLRFLPVGTAAFWIAMDWIDRLTPSLEDLRRRLRGQTRFEPQVALPKMQLGRGSRGFAVVPALMRQTSIVYSFGVDDEANFDLELVGCFGCTVHVFDHRPRNLAWIRDQTLPPQLHVHPFGLADRDGVMAHASADGGSTPRARPSHHPSAEFQVRRLTTLMRQLSHAHIDVLKLEIDGAEYVAVHALAGSSVRPTQILVEFEHPLREFSAARCERAIDQLNALGYRIFDCQPGGHRFSLALV